MAGFFSFSNYNTPGKGVRKDEKPKSALARFCGGFVSRIWKFMTLNLLYILFSIVSLFIVYMVINLGIVFSASLASLDSTSGTAFFIAVFLTLFFYGQLGGGAPSAGMHYIIRNYANDVHAWVWSDFIEHSKKNFKQATLVFIIDVLILVVLIVNAIFYFMIVPKGFSTYVLQAIFFAILLIFIMMHLYIYPLMVTFNLKIREIYKNAFLMVVLKLPRSMAAVLLSSAFWFFIVASTITFTYTIIIIPFLFFTFTTYINTFISYPVIKECMIDNKNDNGNDTPDEKAVFND